MNEFSSLINERIEALRPKLQDTSRRNPLVNNVLNARSASFVRIVDEKPQSIFDYVVQEGRAMRLVPLPPVDIDPPDEDTTEFKNAFQTAQATDEDYLNTIEKIDFEYDEKAFDKQEHADRVLKDRVREWLEMPPRPKSEQFSDLINHAKSHGIDPSSALPDPSVDTGDDRHEDSDLQTLLMPKTFQSRLSRILSKARMYQEERGLDVVYLVLGYVKWTLPNAEKQDEFKSPLLLLPVKLTKSKSSSGETYTVTKLSDPLFNPSLEHKLTVEAKLDLSDIKSLVDADRIDIERFFGAVADLKPKNMHWNVLREASFGIYPFQGIELYYDLDTETCDFSEFSIVSELMVGKDRGDSSGMSEFSEADVESQVGSQLVPHIVMDADSSQFISLLKVANNENVALEGPPGSGKSQTIVNAIANAIFSGKKVLFVAQKVTALEVVLSRLQSLNLDQFVLPLMGGHGGTDEFYEAVENRLKLRSYGQSRDLQNLKLQYEAHRNRLSEYIDLLTQPVPRTGMCVHQLLGLAVSGADGVRDLPIELLGVEISPEKMVEDYTPQDIDVFARNVAEWYTRLSQTGMPQGSVWKDASALSLEVQVAINALENASDAILTVDKAISALDQNSSALLLAFLDNTLSEISRLVREVSSDLELREYHTLVAISGHETVAQDLEQLHNINEELKRTTSTLQLSSSELKLLSASNVQIRKFAKNSASSDLEEVSVGFVDRAKEELIERLAKSKRLLGLGRDLTASISASLTAKHVQAYSAIVKSMRDPNFFLSYIQEVGLGLAKDEVRKAKSIHRLAVQEFAVSTFPSRSTLMELQGILENAGVFSFLSKDVKRSKSELTRLLNSVRSTDKIPVMLRKLGDVIDIAKQWEALGLSSHVTDFGASTATQLDQLLQSIDALQSANEFVGLSETASLKLLNSDTTFEAINLMADLSLTVEDWSELDVLIEETSNQIAALEGDYDDLVAAETLLISLNLTQLSRLSNLPEACDAAHDLFAQREDLIEALGQSFDDDKKLSLQLDASRKYSLLPVPAVQVLFNPDCGHVLSMAESLITSFEEISESYAALLKAKFGVTETDVSALDFVEILNNLRAHREDTHGLNSLTVRRSIYQEANRYGLDDLLRKIDELNPQASIIDLARSSIIAALRRRVQKEFGASLMMFDGTSLSAARQKIKELDKQIIKISSGEVSSKAIENARIPRGNSRGKKSEYTELSLLEHELQKQRRTPPRKVLKRARNALIEMFPCWMMVPSAVAQNLPRKSMFDLVIIDEASQMTPENSISALVRGKNTLIAGDTNQLPPTNFFKGLSVDEEEDEDISTTEESILELANMQFHPKHRLLWHYRSKHEDLISFSNHYVYDNELVIFPSPMPTVKGLGISLVEVNGTFQKGINPAEAQVMLDAIVQFMKDTPERSLGVAVMNQSQMEQLDALVLRAADTDKKVADYLDHWATARGGLERFFVKNLENVQGDERDVIFVGTVYGRDPQGRFYQRFGPINGPAGKRRLNVLFSRAKEQIVTFSSIPMADFNPSATNEGATLLRRWLEFSATKRLGEKPQNHERSGYTDSPFEDHVIEVVQSLGYETVPQVGVSSYYIDIGVKHPSYPYGYICGIECDGATYHSSKSARDRDRLREEVLNRLGWKLYRIWSTDWFRDTLNCREKLKEYLSQRLSELTKDMPEVVDPEPCEIIEDVRILGEEVVQLSETKDLTSEPQAQDASVIEIGTKFKVRYLDGPRAGVVSKFWFQKRTNDPQFEIDGYKSVGVDSPLGEALEGEGLDDIITYSIGTQDIRVQIVELEAN